eukprot:TRINITY_DN47009_c0_g1_i1.p1 TRINITY_DN47009_c0_g1~~TRINITY_DN47009_c0_g1_i1.p1  ORF type:complete len:1317 (+),score=496.16 TRINITY_DN47009_c0_g1_i1:94-3951(+)
MAIDMAVSKSMPGSAACGSGQPLLPRNADQPFSAVTAAFKQPFPVSRTRTQGHAALLEELPGPLLPRPGPAERRHYAGVDDLPQQPDPPPACAEGLVREWKDAEAAKLVDATAERDRATARAQFEAGFVEWLVSREAQLEAMPVNQNSVLGTASRARCAALCAEALLHAVDSDSSLGAAANRARADNAALALLRKAAPVPFRPPSIAARRGAATSPLSQQHALVPVPPRPSSRPPSGRHSRCEGRPSEHSGGLWPAPAAELCLAVACACFDRLLSATGPLAPLFELVRDCIVPRLYAQGAHSQSADWGGLAARTKHYLGQSPYFACDTMLRWEVSRLCSELVRAKEHMRVWAWSIWRNQLRGARRQARFLQNVEAMVSSRMRKLRLREALGQWISYTNTRRADKELRDAGEIVEDMLPGEGSIRERLLELKDELERREASVQSAMLQLGAAAAKQERLRDDTRRAEARARKHEAAAEEALQRHCAVCQQLQEAQAECEELKQRVDELEQDLLREREVAADWRSVGLAMLAGAAGEGPAHDPHVRRRFRAARRLRRKKKAQLEAPFEVDPSSSDDSVASTTLEMSDAAERHTWILRDWGNRVLEEHARTETWRPEGEATRPGLNTFTLETRDMIIYARMLHHFSLRPQEVIQKRAAETGETDVVREVEALSSPRPGGTQASLPKGQQGVQLAQAGKGCSAARDLVAKGGPAPKSCALLFGDLPTMTYVARAAVIMDYATRLIGFRPPVAPADLADGVAGANIMFVSALYLACSCPANHATDSQLIRRVPPPAPGLETLREDEAMGWGVTDPQELHVAWWKAADRARSWRAHCRLVGCCMLEHAQASASPAGRAQPPQQNAQQLRPLASRLRPILLRRSGELGEDEGDDADDVRAGPVYTVVDRNATAIGRVFRHYASGNQAGSPAVTLTDWMQLAADCGIVPRVCSADEAERIFLFSNAAAQEDADPRSLNVEHALSAREFVEGLIRIADLLDRDQVATPPPPNTQSFIMPNTVHGSARASMMTDEHTASLSQPADGLANTGGELFGLRMALSALFSMLLAKYVLLHASQSELDGVRKQIQGEDVQRVLRRYEGPLKAVFFHYVKGHMETGAALELQDFQRCIKDCGFINAEFTHQTVSTIFTSCTQTPGRDEGRMSLHCYLDTLAVVALFKQPSPFTPLAKRLDYFLSRQFFPALRPKVSTLGQHIKLLNAAAMDGVRALGASRTADRKQAALNKSYGAGNASVISGETNRKSGVSGMSGSPLTMTVTPGGMSRSGSQVSVRPRF